MAIKLFDRSRTTTDWKCRRRRYLNYEFNGTGIVSGSAAYELFFGTVIHDATATIAQFHVQENGQVPIDDIVVAGFTQVHDTLLEQLRQEEYAMEQAHLAAGLIRGFYRYEWPRLMRNFPEIIVIEQELVWQDFMFKPDLIVRDSAGNLGYVEYKTTSSKHEKWVDSWTYNPQLHSYMMAIKRQLGYDIEAAYVIGLYKGYEQRGKQNSPFCYAYHQPANPPFTEEKISFEWKAGYKKVPVWQIPQPGASLSSWVDQMPEDVLAEQFIEVPAIPLNEAIADTFFRQARLREQEISMGLKLLQTTPPDQQESLLDAFFSQNLEACKPSFGSGCPYLGVCHHGVDPNDPERWAARQPHHTPEIEARG